MDRPIMLQDGIEVFNSMCKQGSFPCVTTEYVLIFKYFI